MRQLDNRERHHRGLEYGLVSAEGPKVLDDLAKEECDQAGIDKNPEVGGPELPVDQSNVVRYCHFNPQRRGECSKSSSQ